VLQNLHSPTNIPDCHPANCHPTVVWGYIGGMTDKLTGPVAAEIERRLRSALAPERLAVIDDSAKHHGHSGHDPRGESHFTVEIVSAAFAGKSRVQRQRAVNAALADLLADRVHALAIKAAAPGEAA
jgi:BolA protein